MNIQKLEEVFKRINLHLKYKQGSKIYIYLNIAPDDKYKPAFIYYDPKLNEKYFATKMSLYKMKECVEQLINKYNLIKIINVDNKHAEMEVYSLDQFNEFLKELKELFLNKIEENLESFIEVSKEYKEAQLKKFVTNNKNIELITRRN